MGLNLTIPKRENYLKQPQGTNELLTLKQISDVLGSKIDLIQSQIANISNGSPLQQKNRISRKSPEYATPTSNIKRGKDCSAQTDQNIMDLLLIKDSQIQDMKT